MGMGSATGRPSLDLDHRRTRCGGICPVVEADGQTAGSAPAGQRHPTSRPGWTDKGGHYDDGGGCASSASDLGDSPPRIDPFTNASKSLQCDGPNA